MIDDPLRVGEEWAGPERDSLGSEIIYINERSEYVVFLMERLFI